MSDSLRPVTPEEQVPLENLGRAVRALRERAGLPRRSLAESVGIHPQTIARIEHARRRTREDTLTAIAQVLRDELDDATTVDVLLAAARDCLAPPSQYQGRVNRRRFRRFRQASNRHRQRQVEYSWALIRVMGRAMDWAIYSEYQAGQRDWLPPMHLIGSPDLWVSAFYEMKAADPGPWQEPALLAVIQAVPLPPPSPSMQRRSRRPWLC